MTLQQLKYAVKVAEKLSINEAAKELYISQPSLSNASNISGERIAANYLSAHKPRCYCN